jgi:hypothetical protein
VLVSHPRASVLAPPPDFKAFSNSADVIVVGTLVGTTKRVRKNQFGFPATITDHRFAIKSEVKTDGRRPDPETIVMSTSDGPTGQEIAAAFESGQDYVLFLAWVEDFKIYSPIYGLAGAYHVQSGEAQPLEPKTALVQKHGRLSMTQLVALAKTASR